MSFIDTLTQNDILNGNFPLVELLKDSLYYPSCGYDGGVIRDWSKKISSFIYVDYGNTENDFLLKVNTFYGYSLVALRKLSLSDFKAEKFDLGLIPSSYFEKKDYLSYSRALFHFSKKPYAYWAVYDRKPNFDENHGGKRFSLLYVCGEGVATYQALYWTNKLSAKVVAIVQSGTGFGGNWTDFRKEYSPFGWVVTCNPYGKPKELFYGGMGKDYDDLNWNGYTLLKTIENYYRGPYRYIKNGSATIWKQIL